MPKISTAALLLALGFLALSSTESRAEIDYNYSLMSEQEQASADLNEFLDPVSQHRACRGNEVDTPPNCSDRKVHTTGICYGDSFEDTGTPAPCCCVG